MGVCDSLLTTQTHTIRRGALRFAAKISPLLNYLYCKNTHISLSSQRPFHFHCYTPMEGIECNRREGGSEKNIKLA